MKPLWKVINRNMCGYMYKTRQDKRKRREKTRRENEQDKRKQLYVS